jgi:membrane protease YdiL (CAAX protease family)
MNIVNENRVEEQLTSAEPKPRWRELLLYLLVGFGLYFLASLPLVFLVGDDLTDITLGITVLIGILNAVCLVGTVYLTGIRRGKISWASIGLIPPKMEVQWLIIAVVVSLGLIPLRALVGAAVEYLVHGGLDSLEMRGELLFAGAEPNILNFLISFLIIAILVPISEELYFRGLIYRWFQLRFRFWPAVLLSSVIFGLAHYDSLAVVVSSFVMGVVNAIAMERTKSIWVPILMHAVTNGVAVIMIYIALFVEQYMGPLL